MTTFSDLESAAPRLATRIRSRFEATGLAILGTIRADGSPRVSPIEVTLRFGGLYLGMMPGSLKHRDVERDPRVALLTPVADKEDLSGEGKLFGGLRPLRDVEQIAAIFEAATAGSEQFDASDLEGSPVYEVDVRGAAWQHLDGDTWVTESWSTGRGLRTFRRQGATGEAVEV